jgi:hypothetical protein
VTPESSALSPRAFAAPEAGFDYFALEAHCRSLAERIIAALGGFSIVVVTGDPPASARLLSTALSDMAGPRYMAIPLPDAPETAHYDLLHFRRALSASLANGRATGEEPGSATSASPLVILHNADRLSDEQIEEVFKGIYEHRIGAAVVLARPGFLARLERPMLRFWLAKRLLVARLRFQQLGTDEIPAFIHHQLGSGGGEEVFTHEAMIAIANVSGGDPVVVNRFSRRLLDIAAVTTGDRLTQAAITPAAVAPIEIPFGEPRVAILDEPPTRRWCGRSTVLKLSAGAVFGLAYLGLTAMLLVGPAEVKIAASGAPMLESAVAVPENRSATVEAVGSGAAVAASATPGSPPEAQGGSPAELAPTAASALTGVTQEEAAPPRTPAVTAPLEGTTTRVAEVSPAGTVPTATVPAPGPISSTASPPLSTAEIAALLARGDAMFAVGDITSARLFYERAADAGEGKAAVKLAKTFDPVFLYSARLYGVRGDTNMAAHWYRRARDLGEAEAR